MPTTHSDLAVRLLRDAATFFEAVGEQMVENAGVFREVAKLVEQDPTGILEGEDELSGISNKFP